MYYVERQAIYFGIGLVLALLLAQIDYSRLREYKYGLYGVMIALNLVVLGMPQVQGAARWIPLPFFQLQPSEFGKVLLIVSVSAFAVDRSRRLHERRTTARIMLLALIPAMIVIPQPDLGTALVYVAVGFAILFFAGTSWKQLTALAVLFVVGDRGRARGRAGDRPPSAKPYQMQRLTGFLHPSHDPRNQTYNITQSLTAIGSGGKTGLGTAGASQVNLHFLPAPSTDFIFAVVGETYGFVGAAVVLSLYALMIWRGLRILTMSKNLYGTLIAGGVLAMLMFQVFVNTGMTIGIMPITGVPLPLHELWRLLRARDVYRDWPSTVNMCASTHDGCDEEPRIGFVVSCGPSQAGAALTVSPRQSGDPAQSSGCLGKRGQNFTKD